LGALYKPRDRFAGDIFRNTHRTYPERKNSTWRSSVPFRS
jgi:hypothetical protein